MYPSYSYFGVYLCLWRQGVFIFAYLCILYRTVCTGSFSMVSAALSECWRLLSSSLFLSLFEGFCTTFSLRSSCLCLLSLRSSSCFFFLIYYCLDTFSQWINSEPFILTLTVLFGLPWWTLLVLSFIGWWLWISLELLVALDLNGIWLSTCISA